MSTPLFSIVETWTGALPFTITAQGSPLNLDGLRLEAVVHDSADVLVFDTSDRIIAANSTAGELELTPSSSDFMAARSPYRFRLRVSTLGVPAKTAYVPADEHLQIEVTPR